MQAGRRVRLIGGTRLAGILDQIKQHYVPGFQPGQISKDIKRKLANERSATTKSGEYSDYTHQLEVEITSSHSLRYRQIQT